MEIVVVAESRSDKQMACGLADRVIIENTPDWIGDQIEVNRRWRGFDSGTEFTKWSELKGIASEVKVRILGHRHHEIGGFDYAAARKAIVLCTVLEEEGIEGLLLVRDMDRQLDERRRSLNEARSHANLDNLAVLFALPNPMREAWLLNGFVPADEEERQRLQKEKAEIGCDPCEVAETLSGRRDSDRKSPKRILRALTAGERDREENCWKETPLAVLATRGIRTGLVDFLQEVKCTLVPLLKQGR
jgi:hypothetical protein